MLIQLSDHFTYKRLLRFTLPSIMMMIFTSIYGVVDGIFVSNFAGKTSFAAVNFIMPYLMILGCFGFMFGTGGSALIARTLGEGDRERANRMFSFLVYFSIAFGACVAFVGVLLIKPVAAFMGAEGEMLSECVPYGRIILIATPAFMLQMEFQSFFITAERPQLGLFVTVASGVTNMMLDALLVGLLRGGVEGAAVATAVSQAVGGFVPLIYFGARNKSLLRLGKAHFDASTLWRTATNGSSELMSNISMSLVGMLYNIQLVRYAGEDGVAAYGTLMYVSMIFIAIFIGFAVGSAPVISFHFGAENHSELQSLLRKSLVIIGVASVLMVLLGECLAMPLSLLFAGYDAELYSLTLRGFYVYSVSFLFSGVAIYGSSFFTALNNGPVSAAISFLRTLVFQIAAVMLLPLIFDVDGIWFSIIVAELMATAVTVIFLVGMRKKYHY